MKYLAIDVGGTFIKHALITENGIQKVRSEKTVSTNIEDFEQQILKIIDNYQKENIEGIGFSVPGKVDPQTGILYHGGALPFLDQYHLTSRISQQVNLPVKVENDAKAACLAEWHWGNLKNTTSSLALVLGTAVGAGIISQGQLLTGPHLQAGEVSYLILDRALTSYESFTGAQGSAVQLVRRLREVFPQENLSNPELFSLIEGNVAAQNILQSYCSDIAKIIFNLHVLFDLEKIVLGGGISQQPALLDYVIKEVQRIYANAGPVQQIFEIPTIENAYFLSDANLFGSILPFFSEKEILEMSF
ncbi:ROK family protein [Enterococcus timonensis]|uniref:ROK family protein n=1 Tax=Enterococcus timonensis TaxID=1852364 RepID=UPI0008DB22AB|nr:ROK family protein [Enterococcus timonensis]